jgi:hypothetical protein
VRYYVDVPSIEPAPNLTPPDAEHLETVQITFGTQFALRRVANSFGVRGCPGGFEIAFAYRCQGSSTPAETDLVFVLACAAGSITQGADAFRSLAEAFAGGEPCADVFANPVDRPRLHLANSVGYGVGTFGGVVNFYLAPPWGVISAAPGATVEAEPVLQVQMAPHAIEQVFRALQRAVTELEQRAASDATVGKILAAGGT